MWVHHLYSDITTQQSTMVLVDLYLGAFLILSGFALSLLNLRRIIKNDSAFSSVLLSENLLLLCVGIAFVSRSIYELNPVNVDVIDMERSSEIKTPSSNDGKNCDFWAFVLSYGPLFTSFCNSFLSLIIDNYMHYQMLGDVEQKEHEDTVQDISRGLARRSIEVKKVLQFLKKYFSFIAIAMQWLMPVFIVLSMYPMGVQQMVLPTDSYKSLTGSCMAMLEMKNESCNLNNTDVDQRNYVPTKNYLEVHDFTTHNRSKHVEAIISNIYKIVADHQKESNFSNVTSMLYRKGKFEGSCMKMCYVDNKKLTLYIFIFAIVSYFIPITISTMILTKIHVMKLRKPNVKTYVSRELLYNVLFWTPVMFDTFFSLLLCSYSMNGMKTSLFNVVANVYQAVKNFMNTKYFKNNSVVPL